MATERLTMRLSDLNPAEAEIISILRNKADGRKTSWLRDVLLVGFQTLKATNEAALMFPGLVAISVPSAMVDKDSDGDVRITEFEPVRTRTPGKRKSTDRGQKSRSQNIRKVR